ncbi:hypothetical protein EVA_20329 [gut metagenome]|uniref:Uncharacterized protein n=1 Tax=gut metagenome TaxID=749906 RepID=J9FW61_9ZZZZ
MNPITIFSNSSGAICPWPIPTRQSGTYLWIISAIGASPAIRSLTKNTCPPRLISKLMASAITSLEKVAISVCMG